MTAHCPNPGAMLGLAEPGLRVWLSLASNPRRKLPYTWEMVEVLHPIYGRPDISEATMLGMNTMTPNRLVQEAFERGDFAEKISVASWKSEVQINPHSRVDFSWTEPDGEAGFLEVKNVHLVRQDGLAEFPDCVTARGTKHLKELTMLARQGIRCVMLYVVQRADVTAFREAADLDPAYGAAAQLAREAGVETWAFNCHVNQNSISLNQPLECPVYRQ